MVLSRSRLVAPALAVALALVAILTHAQGVDVAAATYRVGLFARSGLTLWDSQWYGGHWTFNYSVIFAPIGWLTGIPLMEIFCVAVAAWAFDRLAVARFGRSGRIAALVFAAGTIVQVSIGQEPYLLGETIGLVALVAAHARHWRLAMALAVACALASPLTGGFMALAALAWMVGVWPEHRWALVGLAAAATVPVGALELLFPGQGMMPFATLNFIGMTLGCLALGVVVAVRRDRALTAGVALYAAALVFTYAVPSAIGANITRLGISFGVALVVALAGESRRGRALLVAAAVPIALAQWVPALGPLTGQFSPSMRAAYFQPLLGFLHRADRPLGRVEVVPTAFHWEAAYVAPEFPLARGWERQLDTANNSIFYVAGKLNAGSYRTLAVRQRRALRRAARRRARLRGEGRGPARAPRRAGADARLAQRALARVRGRGGPGHRLRPGAPACARTAPRSCSRPPAPARSSCASATSPPGTSRRAAPA